MVALRLLVTACAVVALSGCTAVGTGDPNEATPDVDAAIAAHVGLGSWPFNVTFGLAGPTGPADWTVDVDGRIIAHGDHLPATLEHTFAQGTKMGVTLSVMDGTRHSAASVVVDGIAAAAATGIEQVQAVSWVVGRSEYCPPSVGRPPGGDGILYDAFPLDVRTVGMPFRAEVTPAVPHPLGLVAGVVDFLDGSGAWLGYEGDFRVDGTTTIIEGLVPEGAQEALFWSCDPQYTLQGLRSGVYRAGGLS